MRRHVHARGLAVHAAVVLAAVLTVHPAALAQQRIPSSAGDLAVETVASGLENPWGLAFLPDGRMLVTEKAGQILLVSADGKTRSKLASVAVAFAGQGGLLDVAVDPQFATNQRIWYS